MIVIISKIMGVIVEIKVLMAMSQQQIIASSIKEKRSDLTLELLPGDSLVIENIMEDQRRVVLTTASDNSPPLLPPKLDALDCRPMVKQLLHRLLHLPVVEHIHLVVIPT